MAVATLKDGQNLNFAVPSKYLAQLSANATTVKPLAVTRSDKGRTIGAPLTEGVIAHSFTWGEAPYLDEYFSLSLVNKLRDPVGNVTCLVVFYNKEGLPLDSVQVWGSHGGIPRIEPGAAVRVSGKVDREVKRLASFVPHTVTDKSKEQYLRVRDPDGLVHEFRASWTNAQVNAYMENYWKQREGRTQVRIISFEVLR